MLHEKGFECGGGLGVMIQHLEGWLLFSSVTSSSWEIESLVEKGDFRREISANKKVLAEA